ncbi:FlxA-like family protein [Bradyrhizobium cenepequi]
MTSTALFAVWMFNPLTASAQSASGADKIEKLEHQTELLQKQIKELKDEIARTRKKTDKVEAAQASAAAAPPPAPLPPAAKGPLFKAPQFETNKVKVTLGGFLAAESVWRQRNEVADIGSNLGGIPYPFSPLYHENEFHGSARQSRISLLAEAQIDPLQAVAGYFEVDFLGAGTTSNFNQSNSWAPRLRHGYGTYDNSYWGLHVLAGQSWSLLTQNQVGITPRKENIPLTIDASYVDGFNYTRNWQVRLVKDFGPQVSLGISIENPATIVGASTATAPAGTGGNFASGSLVNGIVTNFNNPGSSFLSTATITTDQAPDIIEKAAFDPGWGHYELLGLQRFFNNSTLTCIGGPCISGSTAQNGQTSSKSAFGWGVGGSVLVPVVPKYLEFTGNVLYGQGIGRYGAGQLPDVTIAPDGSLTPLTGLTAMVGLIGHPWVGLDVYAYGGIEQVDASSFNAGTTLLGYGNPEFSNFGCLFATPSSFAGSTPANCIANNRRLSEVTVGFWQNLYKGDYGRIAVGGQYEYLRRQAFEGLGGAPSTDDNIVMTSLRYYPF